ncbi:MAG: multidrug DMT transporter permease [Alistipes sp.]|nr:multidrug DMT transporter permease [Alistipes senegalensis]MCM1250613.1 multidrug DMT transporter permease [Alistipes sp.]
MFIVSSYSLAIVFCFITMLCWGSWGNTQKLAQKSWRYELFYWDYVVGMVAAALLLGLTMGSTGDEGRSFLADLGQASGRSIGWVLLGGVIFNASNILLSASTALAGMSVAFPLGVGLALVLGVFVNYIGHPSGDPVLLLLGVALVVAAIVCNGIASGMHQRAGGAASQTNTKGLWLAAGAGILMSFFFRCVVKGMDVDHFAAPTAGMMTPYSAIFVFSLGVLASNFLFNTLIMRYPFVGERVRYAEYFRGSVRTHAVGMLGGAIWCLGSLASYIASGPAGTAVSYGLGQGATMVAAFWGVFIWREFRGGSRRVNLLIALMFVLFLSGLGLIIRAGN